METPVEKPKKKIAILYTGGTIGCIMKDGKLEPDADGFEQELRRYLAFLGDFDDNSSTEEIPDFDFFSMDEAIDSSNATPDAWKSIRAKLINILFDEDKPSLYCGVVVLHGTDTLAYTSSFLSTMMLEYKLDSPIVITGSQAPLKQPRTDAKQQIITSMLLASNEKAKGVLVCFGNKAFLGSRVTKVDCNGFDAFESPNRLPVAYFGSGMEMRKISPPTWSIEAPDLFHWIALWEKVLELIGKLFSEEKEAPASKKVGVFKLFPGVEGCMVEQFVLGNSKTMAFDGLIIEAYGSGNGPTANAEFSKSLKKISKVIPTFVVSQCIKGSTAPVYQTAIGQNLLMDMTTEAAVTKLYYLLNHPILGTDRSGIESLMKLNLYGEITAKQPQKTLLNSIRRRVTEE